MYCSSKYIFNILLLFAANSMYTMEIDPNFNPFPLYKKLNDIINKNPISLEDTQQILKEIHINCADVPSKPQLYIFKKSTSDDFELFNLIKVEVETQRNCFGPLTFRLQGLQMISEQTAPYAQ